MNIDGNFEATLWRHGWCHHHGKNVFWHNLGRSFHIWGQIEAVFDISKFSKWPPFWARDKLFYRKLYRKFNIPERYPFAFPRFGAFDRSSSSNIDRDISNWKFDLLCDLATSSMTSWICIYTKLVMISWYLHTWSLVMMSVLVFSYHEKCCYFIYKGIQRADFEAILWHHRWRHHYGNFFLAQFGTIFSYLRSYWSCVWYFKIFEMAAILSSRQTFFTGSYTGSWIYQSDSHKHFRNFELLIDALTQILTEIYQFENLTYFVTLWRHKWRHECVKHNLHN